MLRGERTMNGNADALVNSGCVTAMNLSDDKEGKQDDVPRNEDETPSTPEPSTLPSASESPTPCPAPVPGINASISYKLHVAPPVERTCLGGCHSQPNPDHDLAFDSKAALIAEFTDFIRAVEEGKISGFCTPLGRVQFSAEEKVMFRTWQAENFQD